MDPDEKGCNPLRIATGENRPEEIPFMRIWQGVKRPLTGPVANLAHYSQ